MPLAKIQQIIVVLINILEAHAILHYRALTYTTYLVYLDYQKITMSTNQWFVKGFLRSHNNSICLLFLFYAVIFF